MNIRLRNSLSALVIAASLVSLGYAVGEPPRPTDLIFNASGDAVAALTEFETVSVSEHTTAASAQRMSHAQRSLPFFSFGKRASAGAR